MDQFIAPEDPVHQILATCRFYTSSLYTCNGVADCGHGEGILTCAGAAPWSGHYEGSVIEGMVPRTYCRMWYFKK